MPIRILLADDHEMIRAGLRSILEKLPDVQVVAEASDGRAAVQQVLAAAPELAILDISMPELNGIEAARQITSNGSDTRVIILSVHADRRFLTESLAAGAKGYLLKNSAVEELGLAIQAVLRGNTYLSPKVAGLVVEQFVRPTARGEPGVFSTLTPREREVLQLLAEGKTSKEMAACLHVSAKTIETHRHQIMAKLGLRTVAALTKYAVRQGLTSLDG